MTHPAFYDDGAKQQGVFMNGVLMNAYRLALRCGTTAQVHEALRDIQQLGKTVPGELITDVITMMRKRPDAVKEALAWAIFDLVGSTQSDALYQIALELGVFDFDRLSSKVYTDGRATLFVNTLFYRPDLELIAIEELFRWVTYFEQTIRQHYRDDLARGVIDGYEFMDAPEYDARLKSTDIYAGPLWAIGRILEALGKIGSIQGRESLRAMESLFRSQSNKYLRIEKKRAQDGDTRAIAETDDSCYLSAPTVFHLRMILDQMIAIAESVTPSEPPS
jgi:hypothetical protein